MPIIRPSFKGKPWTPFDVATLIGLARQKIPPRIIALQMSRTESAIRRKAKAEGIVLTEEGEEPPVSNRWRRR